jgi:hypothetical protein
MEERVIMQTASRFRALMTVLPILAGVAAGVASSAVLAGGAGPSGGAPPAVAGERLQEEGGVARAVPRRPGPGSQVGSAAVTGRLAALEERVEELSAEHGAGADEAAVDTPEAIQEAREEDERRAAEEFRAKLEAYRHEPVDAEWARSARARLAAGMAALSADEAHGVIGDVDCKSTSCLANVTFPSYEAARNEFGRYVTAFYDVPCARTAVLDEPDDPAAPFQVQVLFGSCARPD